MKQKKNPFFLSGIAVTFLISSPINLLAAPQSETNNIPEQIVISTACLNVRNGPSTNHKIINKVTEGQVLTCMAKIDDWYVVKLKNNEVGTLFSKYTKNLKDVKTNFLEDEDLLECSTIEDDIKNYNFDCCNTSHNVAYAQNLNDCSKLNNSETSSENLLNDKKQKITLNETIPNAYEIELQNYGEISSQEYLILQLINKERSKYGLKPYKLNYNLTQSARTRAQKLEISNFTLHPENNSAKHTENVFKNKNIEMGHKSLMASKAHRDNILSHDFLEIGIGIVKNKKGENVVVEFFNNL